LTSPAARFAAAGIALPAALAAAVVAINLFDRELSPEARAYLESGAPPKFSRDTGWALLNGIDAPIGVDPREHAARRHRDIEREERGRPTAPEGKPLAVRGGAELLCTPESADCLELLRARPDSVDALVEDNRVLLERYDELQRTPGLADAFGQLFFISPNVHFGVVMDTQRVRLSEVAALVLRGRSAEAARLLEADAAFFRRWLAQSGSLLAKMLAARGLARDLLLAAEISRGAPSLTPEASGVLARVAAPLGSAERGFAPILRHEAWSFMGRIDRLVADPRTTSKVFGPATPLLPEIAGRTLRRNDTLNRMVAVHRAWEALDGADSIGIVAAIDAASAERVRLSERDWTAIYNFAGRSILAEDAVDIARYVKRLRDLDALAAASRCVVRLHAARVPREAAAVFVAQECANPLTGKSLTWDAGRNLLGFVPLDTGNVARFGGAGQHVALDVY
jgi:hypothetical protein